VSRVARTDDPLVLTINGKAELVVQDATAYQRLLDLAARADREEMMAAIRDGLADADAGRVKPARKALKALARKIRHSCCGRIRCPTESS
jgi:predicted transcriptional regulator